MQVRAFSSIAHRDDKTKCASYFHNLHTSFYNINFCGEYLDLRFLIFYNITHDFNTFFYHTYLIDSFSF